VPEPRREELPRPVPAQSLETYLERRTAGHPSSSRRSQ
jgi:hypothetical protein